MADNTNANGGSSSGAIVAIVAIIAILAVLFFLWQNGTFSGGGDGETNVDVDIDPGGAVEEVVPDAAD